MKYAPVVATLIMPLLMSGWPAAALAHGPKNTRSMSGSRSRPPILPVLFALALTAWAAFAGGPVHGASYTVNVAAATVEGKSAQILTDADGLALYYLTSDSLASPACTGGCVKAWPPLLSSTTPTGPSSLPGKLTVVQAANGSQVSYNGHLLYRYGADTKSGQVNGNRVAGPKGGEWYVATSSMAVVRGGGTDNNDRGDGGMGNY